MFVLFSLARLSFLEKKKCVFNMTHLDNVQSPYEFSVNVNLRVGGPVGEGLQPPSHFLV